jgi:sec-independent protein translocase protein TatC
MSEDPVSQDSPTDLWDHLMELRARLVRSLIAVGAGFVLSAVFARQIVAFLKVPMEVYRRAHPGVPALFRDPEILAGFSTFISVSLFGGLVLAMPYILWQVWGFVRPGLQKRERLAAVPLILGGTALFLAGVAVAYFFVAPAALNFLFTMNRMFGIEETSSLQRYIRLILMLMLGFGVGFQLPLVMLILTWVGIVDPGFFRSRRKYALVLAFVFGALLTPPDVPSQLIMAACLLVLYELGILLSVVAERRWAARQGGAEADEPWQKSPGNGD